MMTVIKGKEFTVNVPIIIAATMLLINVPMCLKGIKKKMNEIKFIISIFSGQGPEI